MKALKLTFIKNADITLEDEDCDTIFVLGSYLIQLEFVLFKAIVCGIPCVFFRQIQAFCLMHLPDYKVVA